MKNKQETILQWGIVISTTEINDALEKSETQNYPRQDATSEQSKQTLAKWMDGIIENEQLTWYNN